MVYNEKYVYEIIALTKEGCPLPFFAETYEEALALQEALRSGKYTDEEYLEVRIAYKYPEKDATFYVQACACGSDSEEEYKEYTWKDAKALEKELLKSGKYDFVCLTVISNKAEVYNQYVEIFS